MTLLELKQRVDHALSNGRNDGLEVIIPNNGPSMGFTSGTKVKWVGQGIDWDHNTFFIWPENEMIEQLQNVD